MKSTVRDDRLAEAFRFYLLACTLKDKIRSGWDQNHWQVSAERLESVAEHSFETCILAIALHSVGDKAYRDVSLKHVIYLLVIHDIGEAVMPDFTPFDGISPAGKATLEAQAVIDVIGEISPKAVLYQLFLEFESRETKEAHFAHLCDKLQSDLQAKLYQDQGYMPAFDELDNGFLDQIPVAQQMIKDGAKTPFDLFERYDRHLYASDGIFREFLQIAKNHDLADLTTEYLADLRRNS